MRYEKNKVVDLDGGHAICFRDKSWLCHGGYWCDSKENAAIYDFKIVAIIVALYWDAQRRKAGKKKGR